MAQWLWIKAFQTVHYRIPFLYTISCKIVRQNYLNYYFLFFFYNLKKIWLFINSSICPKTKSSNPCLTKLLPIYQNKHWTIRWQDDCSVDLLSHCINVLFTLNRTTHSNKTLLCVVQFNVNKTLHWRLSDFRVGINKVYFLLMCSLCT